MDTYEIIKTLCKNHHVPVTVLEKELGFSRGSLIKMKGGKSASADRIKKIADYFGVSPDYLITGEAANNSGQYYLDPETAEIAQKIFEDPDLRGLFHIAKDLPPQKLKAHYELMKLMYEAENPDD